MKFMKHLKPKRKNSKGEFNKIIKKILFRQEAIFKTQEEAIRERDLAIQEQLIRFCKFLQENEAKKNRADRRAQEEERLRDQKQKEIDALKINCQDLQRQQDKLDRKVRALKKYEDYLENVKNSNQDQYNDPGEIIQRYKTLIKSNEHLVRDHSNLEQEFEKLKIECGTYEKEKNHEILQLNNEIKDLQKILEVFLEIMIKIMIFNRKNKKKGMICKLQLKIQQRMPLQKI